MRASRRDRLATRLFFGGSAAAFAAAGCDYVVESLANAGAFGSGRFTDGSNADVVPTMLAGFVFLVAFLVVGVRRALRLGTGGTSAVRTLPGRSILATSVTHGRVLPLLPVVYIAQIGLLFCMESAEQLITTGHLAGGTVWLGGPAAISLALHAIACVLVVLAARGLVRALEPQTARLVIALLAYRDERPTQQPVVVGSRVAHLTATLRSSALRSVGKRAPPTALSFA